MSTEARVYNKRIALKTNAHKSRGVQKLKLFISWSRPVSHSVAKELQRFADEFFESKKLTIYISSGAISPGEQWFESIKGAITESDICVIVLSDENEKSRWVHFESGAIAYNTKSSNIVPFLVTSRELDERSPLRHYQYIKNCKKDVERLFRMIKKAGKFTRVRSDEFSKRFNRMYPKFEKNVRLILEQSVTGGVRQIPFADIFPSETLQVEKGKVFVGAPMAGYNDKKKYEVNRLKVKELEENIRICCSATLSSYWAGNEIEGTSKFDGEQTALLRDLSHLKSSQFCVFVLFESLPTSVHIEIGYAIALDKKIVIFCKNRKDLPFLLRRADAQISNVSIYQCSSYEEISKLFEKDGNAILSELPS